MSPGLWRASPSTQRARICRNRAVRTRLLIVRLQVIDSVKRVRPEHWDRIVCVFVHGPAWQFKGWRWGSPAQIFQKALGMYVRYEDVSPPTTVVNWKVGGLGSCNGFASALSTRRGCRGGASLALLLWDRVLGQTCVHGRALVPADSAASDLQKSAPSGPQSTQRGGWVGAWVRGCDGCDGCRSCVELGLDLEGKGAGAEPATLFQSACKTRHVSVRRVISVAADVRPSSAS